MSSDPPVQAGGPIGGDPSGQAAQPSEEELRAAYEAELSRISSADMILQAAVSLLNLGGRRLGPIGDRPAPGAEGERDLAQVRDAIDAVRALLQILERSAPEELRPLRDALAQLQMAYAREAQAGGEAGQSAQPPAPAAKSDAPAAEDSPDVPVAPGKPGTPPAEGKPGAGPAESSGRLWVPGR
jgi:hypothetical protein